MWRFCKRFFFSYTKFVSIKVQKLVSSCWLWSVFGVRWIIRYVISIIMKHWRNIIPRWFSNIYPRFVPRSRFSLILYSETNQFNILSKGEGTNLWKSEHSPNQSCVNGDEINMCPVMSYIWPMVHGQSYQAHNRGLKRVR